MTTFVHRWIGRRPWVLVVAFLLATMLADAPPAFGYSSKLKCGKPTKTGRIYVEVALRNQGGTPATVLVPVSVDSSMSAEQKALEISVAFNAVADGNQVRSTLPNHGTEITFKGEGDWYVQLVGVAADSTGEPDQISLGLPTPISEQEGLCSLTGTASGIDAQGGPGFVTLRVGGALITQQTWPGMPSAVIEQMLIGQLNGAGIPARFATPSDFEGYDFLQHDPQVIWFPIPDTTGVFEEIGDVGLFLDLAAVLDGTPDTPTSAPVGVEASGLQLEVYPTLFCQDALHVRFAAGWKADRIRLEVFDVAGRLTRTLFHGALARPGALTWDGRDERHALLPDGVYFVRLSATEGSLVRRVVRLRE